MYCCIGYAVSLKVSACQLKYFCNSRLSPWPVFKTRVISILMSLEMSLKTLGQLQVRLWLIFRGCTISTCQKSPQVTPHLGSALSRGKNTASAQAMLGLFHRLQCSFDDSVRPRNVFFFLCFHLFIYLHVNCHIMSSCTICVVGTPRVHHHPSSVALLHLCLFEGNIIRPY